MPQNYDQIDVRICLEKKDVRKANNKILGRSPLMNQTTYTNELYTTSQTKKILRNSNVLIFKITILNLIVQLLLI